MIKELKHYAIKILVDGAFYGWIMYDNCQYFITDDINNATIFTTCDVARAKLHELEHELESQLDYDLDYELKIIELRGLL